MRFSISIEGNLPTKKWEKSNQTATWFLRKKLEDSGVGGKKRETEQMIPVGAHISSKH